MARLGSHHNAVVGLRLKPALLSTTLTKTMLMKTLSSFSFCSETYDIHLAQVAKKANRALLCAGLGKRLCPCTWFWGDHISNTGSVLRPTPLHLSQSFCIKFPDAQSRRGCGSAAAFKSPSQFGRVAVFVQVFENVSC